MTIFSKHRLYIIFFILTLIAMIPVLTLKVLPIENANYIFFSVGFFSLLLISFIKPISEFFVLMNFFLFLGFWGKLTIYVLTNHRLGEAAGQFNIEILNKAALTSGWFSIVILVFQIILKNKRFRIEARWKKNEKIVFPIFFHLIFLSIVFIVSLLNYQLKIFQVGVASSYSLFLPISIFFYWFIGPGSSFLTFSLTSKEYRYRDTLMIALTMTAVSVTTISRNALLYFSYPVLVKFILEIKNYKKALTHSFIVFLFFVFSLLAITQMRRTLYFPEDKLLVSKMTPEAAMIPHVNWKHSKENLVEVFLDRWIGLEGVLVALAHRSDDHFKILLNENAKINRTSLYHSLSGSAYPTTGNYLFYTLPGPMGLLAFVESNSLKILSWLTYLSLLAITYFCIEFFLTGLPKSAIAWWAASNMSQLSLFPIYNLKIYSVYFVLIILFAFILKIISDQYFEKQFETTS